VLGHGQLPLSALTEVVSTWIDERITGPKVQLPYFAGAWSPLLGTTLTGYHQMWIRPRSVCRMGGERR
jgi:hypothetical protein